MKVYDLFCGLGGWSEGFLAEGYECVGFDIEAHDYGTGGYPGTLVLRDIRSIHGSELKDATVIVASPPCQAYSYRAMPWKRAKALPPPDNTLFNECFRIQREASEAAGHHIPLIVENVRGAQKWVGCARWNYGSFYLWGDVPALMPFTRQLKRPGRNFHAFENGLGSSPTFCGADHETRGVKGIPHRPSGHWTNPAEYEGVKQPGISGPRDNGKGDAWFQDGAARHGSKSNSRKAASAMIAKIPFPLAKWIAKCFKP
jgi:hypothetical protein